MKYFTKLILSFLVFFSALNVQAQTATVTFRVDMQNVTDAFTTPEVNGTFNNWCGNCAAMSDADGDNIWDVAITLNTNTDYEYKFSADTWTIQENLFSGDPCTNDGSTGLVNRILNVSGDTDLGVVCWNSCDDCSVAPSHYSITFEVDMSTCTDAFTTPEVNSTLNNWCGNCWQMTDTDGDNVWQHTALVASGATPEYKFSADGWSTQEILDPTLGCAEFLTTTDLSGTFTNRQVTITQDETFSAPWNGCNLINQCGATAPTNEEFSTGLLPVGTCSPNQWAVSNTSGSGWVFTGPPGYEAGSNGRTAGTYAWIDFSGTDVGCVLEVEDIDVSGLTTASLVFDYFSDYGIYSSNGYANNEMNIEAWDGTTWNLVANLAIQATGWNTYVYDVSSNVYNTNFLSLRFRGESGGASGDFYQDLLLDNVQVMETPVSGCMNTLANNYDPSATIDDGSCTFPACLGATPSHEEFSTGSLPLGSCYPNPTNPWAVSNTSGSGWVFSGIPGYEAAANGRAVGTYTWVDFSGTDVGCVLETEDFDVSGLTTATVVFDYFSDYGTYASNGYANNEMNVEAWDGTTWNLVANLAIQATGWNSYAYDVSSFIYNTNELTLRFRAESGGVPQDYYQDLLLDDVKVQEAPTYGCTDPTATNYDATVDIEDGSCTYVNGCMDASAFNYDPSATLDDGSCYFCGCTDFTLNMVDSWGDGWNGNTWSANNAATGESVGPFTIPSGYTGTATFCLSSGNWDWTAGGGSFANEISWDLLDSDGNIVTSGAGAGTGTFAPADVLGCTDPVANNFMCGATTDDGSCLGLYLQGIMDFTVPGGGFAGKAIHVTAATDIPDLSVFGVGVANNGGGTDGQEYTFDAISVLAGEHILAARDTAVMLAYLADCSVEFDHVLVANSGISQNGDDAIELFFTPPLPPPPPSLISNCGDFVAGPNAWPYVLVATTLSDGASSQLAQTFTMNVTSLPSGGANFRVFKTTANGGSFFGNPVALTLGSNTITVAAVSFDRAVKFQFSSGDVEFDALSLNGVDSDCNLPAPAPSLITNCGDFVSGPNAWPFVLVATTLSDGANSQLAQTFTMNVTTLPSGGANFRVYKTTANGGDFFGNPIALTLGSNTITVAAVSFDRAVKFQFSSGDVEFDALSLNGVNSNCNLLPPPSAYVVETFGEIDVDGTNDPWEYMDSWAYKNAGVGTVELFDLSNWSFGGVNCTDGTTTIYDASCPYPICPVLGCTDALASNYDGSATSDDGSCLFATTFNVNMSCESASSFSTVSLESPLFNWCGGCVPMTDPDGDGTYSVTVDLAAGSFEYKYATDNFSGQEDLIDDMVNGGTCAPITDYFSYANREAIVAAGFVANDTYGTCSPCLLPGCTDSTANNYDASYLTNDGSCTYDVTFSVDLRCSGLTPSVVTATGDYDNWSGNTYNLSDADGDGIWEGTYSFAEGTFQFLYITDNYTTSEISGLINSMQNGATCAPNTDYLTYAYRMLTVGNVTTSDTYASCDACAFGCMDAAASNYDANAQLEDGSCVYATTFSVNMNCEPLGSFGYVHLESPLFGWCGGCVAMTDADGDGIHTVTVDLPLGDFEYKYAVDGFAGQEDLIDDMVNGGTCAPLTDYYSYANRQLTVAVGSTADDVYGSCDPCNTTYGCTDALASNYDASSTDDDGSCLFATTFNVDMNCQPAGSFGYVHLESPLFGWCGGCVPMTDADGDGIHSVTVDLAEGPFEYKYAVDGFAGQEDLISAMVNGGDCAPITDYYSYANRQFNVNLDYTYGSEMVSNGNFYVGGSEMVTNGTFDTDTDWNKENGSTITEGSGNVIGNGYLSYSGSNWSLSQDVGFNSGSTYEVTFKAKQTSGTGSFQVGQGYQIGFNQNITNSFVDYSFTITAVNYGSTGFSPTEKITIGGSILGDQFEIDDVSVKELSPDGSGWNYGSNWLHSGSIAYSNGSNSNGLEEANFTANSGTLYSVTYDVGALTQGTYQVSLGGTLGTERSTIGTYTELITASSSISLMIMANNNAIGAVDNISVIEITNVTSVANDVYSSCDECILGCTDVLAWNFDSTAISDDGSCLYASNCANPIPTNLGVNWTTDTKASINWDNMNDGGDCRVIKYFTRYRTGGSNAWSVKSAGVGSGLCNIGLSVTDKTLQNLASGEIYEFQMKAFYCGGGVSGWSNSSYFATQSDCPEITNLSVETFNSNHSKAKFTWDTTGTYVFARIALRVDTAGSSWQTAGGFGVYYPALSVNKFGLTSGQSYRSQGRTFCDANITSFRSDWTSPIFWTQPGILPSKVDGSSALIQNFNVYPNPSSDIFNISFVSEEVQNLKIRVVNMLGEVVSSDDLERFVGEYTKQINLEENTKGVYFLEIITNQGVVNKKIVLQ